LWFYDSFVSCSPLPSASDFLLDIQNDLGLCSGRQKAMPYQFLSSHSNRRKDRWGGSLENKYRIVGEIFKKAKELVGDYPILAKINAHDGRKNGMRIEEAVKIAQMLETSGCAAIEVSCGTVEDGFYTMRGEKLPADAALRYIFKYKKIPGLLKRIAKPVLKAFIKQPKPLLK
jgi:2,4-dienoyl-CoA reductase-like NADH-dependent reductase (Old Yellow Enzyme family)